jgi:hypothetical protein
MMYDIKVKCLHIHLKNKYTLYKIFTVNKIYMMTEEAFIYWHYEQSCCYKTMLLTRKKFINLL